MIATVIVPSWNGAQRLQRLLPSLSPDSEVVVVDNGSTDGTADLLARRFPQVEILRLASNHGFSKAVNRAAAIASSDAIVLVNDDCVCEPGFAERLAGALDPARGVPMAAGVLLEAHDPTVIDSAGVELDDTLLVFDYLNGEPVEVLDRAVADPLGPSGSAAAFDRSAFIDCGGFDERLFAYWEDVDLILRLRVAGGRCVLVPDARAIHSHSATLGPGSARKDYLTGFGRGYVLRKWGVLAGGRGAVALAREAGICAAQLAVDRTPAGIRGRIAGWHAAGRTQPHPFPAAAVGVVAPLDRARVSTAREQAAPPAAGNDRMTGLVDVAVVSHRCRDLLRRCLTSIEEHAPAGTTTWVVDNASNDGTVELVQEQFPAVHLIANDRNVGFAAATNAAIREGIAPYVLALNPDAELRAGTLDVLLELMRERPEVGIAGCRLERLDGSFDHASRRSFPTVLGALSHLSGVGRRAAGGPLAQYRAPRIERGPVDAVNGAFMLLRRSALEEVGLFDERYWMYMEDMDLSYRFKEAGWTTWYEPSVTALHVKHGTSGQVRGITLTVAFYRGMARFVVAHPATVPNPATRFVVLVGIACVGAFATSRAAARSVVEAARRHRHSDTTVSPACDVVRKVRA